VYLGQTYFENGKRVSNDEPVFVRVVIIYSNYSDCFYFISLCLSSSYSKPSGIRAGRKLRIHRRNQRWQSKVYNKSHSVFAMKANPLAGACMSKGIVLEKM
jgi:hypothetical protein